MYENVEKKQKAHFCEGGCCAFILFLLVLAAIAVVVLVTFLSPAVRAPYVPPAPDDLPWWKTTIIYQIYPRSFQDSNGDGTGDLKGITSRLSYFNDLNVGAIWLSPFYTSPMRDFGYDITNYTEVDDIFGTMKDFEDLIKEAHSKDIKVIVDFVPNHSSNESAWFQQSRDPVNGGKYKDYYIWSTGSDVNKVDGHNGPPNNWQSVFDGPAWQWDGQRQAYYYHAFLDSQPDLNYRNPDVLSEMDDVLRFWLAKGVDGFRIDAVPHLFELENQTVDEPAGANNGFDPNLHKYTKNQPEIFDVVRRWRGVVQEYEARDSVPRFLLAETAGISQEHRVKYYEAGSVPFYFDLILAKDTAKSFLDYIKAGLTTGNWPNFVIGNHDNPRVSNRIGDVYVDAMNMLLLTLPGTPTTYYGEELGMRNGDYSRIPPKDPYAITSHNPANSRDPERNPMQWNTSAHAGFTSGTPWLPISNFYQHINVEVESKQNVSSLALYKKLALLRQKAAFQNEYIGMNLNSLSQPLTSWELPELAKNILVYTRGTEMPERYLVAVNLGSNLDSVDVTNIGAHRGTVELSTTGTTGDVDLTNIQLDVGEGVIVKLQE